MIDINHKYQEQQNQNYHPINCFILADQTELSLDEYTPSILMPIINKPLLYYQLEFLERNFIREVHILTLSDLSFKLNNAIHNYKGNIKPTILTTTRETFEETNILKFIEKKVTQNNFIIFRGDSIVNFDLCKLLDLHLLQSNFISMVVNREDTQESSKSKLIEYGNTETLPLDSTNIQILGLKQVEKAFQSEDVIDESFDENFFGKLADKDSKPTSNRDGFQYRKVVYDSFIEKSSFSGAPASNKVKINKNLLVKSRNFELVYNYKDIYFYIFSRSIFDFLDLDRIANMKDLRKELIPFLIEKSDHKLIKRQLTKSSLKHKAKYPSGNLDTKNKSSNETSKKELDKIAEESEGLSIFACLLDSNCFMVDSFNKILNTINEIQKPFENINKIFFSTRNNLDNIFEDFKDSIYMNIENNKHPGFNLPVYIEITSMDSHVAKPISVEGKKCNITKSVIGSNLKLGENTKIRNSLVLDNCNIGNE